jgi:hypothetical protein
MSGETPEAQGGQGLWASRARLGAAVLFGAAVVGVCWIVFGGGGGGSAAPFQVSAGIPPVAFDYLDNVAIASYLAQLQGGTATTESLSRQATEGRNASVGASGVGLGASSSQESAAQLSLTVNDQARFADLLDLLQSDGFLHTIDMSAPDDDVRKGFDELTAGTFVKLSNCSLALPRYVQDQQLFLAELSEGAVDRSATAFAAAASASEAPFAARDAFRDRQRAQGLQPGQVPVPLPKFHLPSSAGLNPDSTLARLVRKIGANPRVPLSSCSPGGYDPNVPDLLMPIRFGELSSTEGGLAGQVTLIGKVMLVVRGRLHMDDPGKHGYYVDRASLQEWGPDPEAAQGTNPLSDEATVLGPGYVIQPIAIYK